jgi:oligosaccharide repeat unit polymerase
MNLFLSFLSLLWLPFLFVIIYLTHKISRSITNINIYTYFFYSFFLYHGLFIPFLHDVNLEAIGLVIPPASLIRWYISLMIMYSFLIGTIAIRSQYAKYIQQRNGVRTNIISKGSSLKLNLATTQDPGFNLQIYVIMLAIVGLLFVALWDPRLLVESFVSQLSAEEYKASRVAYGDQFSSFNGNIGNRIATSVKGALLPMILYIFYFARQQGNKYKIGFWIIFVVSLLLQLITGAKHGVATIFIGIFFCNRIQNNATNILGKNLLTLLIGILFLLFVIFPLQYSFQYPTASYDQLLYSTMYRLTAETSRVLQLHFYLYPDTFPHLLGQSSSIISQLFGAGEILDPGRVARSYLEFGNTYDDTGTWNAAFIGAAWADFGYPGVILESILLSSLLYSYEKWYLKTEKTALSNGTYVSLIMSASNLTQINLLTGLLSFGLASSFIFYIILKKINGNELPYNK